MGPGMDIGLISQLSWPKLRASVASFQDPAGEVAKAVCCSLRARKSPADHR